MMKIASIFLLKTCQLRHYNQFIIIFNKMTLHIKVPDQDKIHLKPVITVFGVGGAGGNAINNMISSKLEGVRFVAANTDAQALEHSLADKKIQLGHKLTQGLGAGSKSEIGAEAAEDH
jgi:cell division protein FtsZ